MNLPRLASAGLIGVALLRAQAPAMFEAASIKPGAPLTDRIGDGPRFNSDPGRITYTSVTLRDCIEQAWGLKGYQIEGPKSIDGERFNIVATAAAATPPPEMMRMLRSLLTERFKMSVRMETRQLPVYALTAGPKPKLNASAPDTLFSKGIEGGKFSFRHISMEQFAEILSGFRNRPVLDETGLTGFYDISLDVFDDPADTKRIIRNSEMGDFIAAAVEPQLGLRLESRKSPTAMLVVDRVERMPIDN